MYKYSFLVYHQEYNNFLLDLQDLGVIHVLEQEIYEDEKIKKQYALINQVEKNIQFLEKNKSHQSNIKPTLRADELIDSIYQKQLNLEQLNTSQEEIKKELNSVKPWGEFSHKTINTLQEKKIYTLFYTCSKKKFSELNRDDCFIEQISEAAGQVYFMVVSHGDPDPAMEAERIKLPDRSLQELEKEQTRIRVKIEALQKELHDYANTYLPILNNYHNELLNVLELDLAVLNTSKTVEQKVMVLEGWVPVSKREEVEELINDKSILYYAQKATPEDKVPVLLSNNRFSKLFEPIGSMFSLPDYSELDLTIFFAPFFMMFFGFCLGDAGYGLLFIVGGGLYKMKASKEIKPYLTLIQFLGLATVIFGSISGTFFGINLIEAEISWTENFKQLFLNPDKMFNLALILGGVQIIFGLFIRAANQIKQFGFSYSLATFGWLFILIGSVIYSGLVQFQVIETNKTILYACLGTGGVLILFFNDPKINVFARVGKGVWDVYSTVTGIFGDLLSYIRLFALGLSSAILGFVINDIALQILASSKIIGPLFFVVFLLLGHTLNILISSLGSFVHPMRLTFVEFYKSAGFIGGGRAYNPLKKRKLA